jgi:fructose-1,6-bisphosphatase III
MTQKELNYLKLLAKRHPNVASASTEIINLQAILSLPKGTEHFMSDLHGEYEAFTHILNNASGVIKRKIQEIFRDSMRQSEKDTLATLIYYPKEKLQLIRKKDPQIDEWYKMTLNRLILVLRSFSSKYTRSKVRKALPNDFSYIIEELLHTNETGENKQEYYSGIIDTIIRIRRADDFIEAICNVIKKLAIDRLHIIGDIFDRGPSPDLIMDTLMTRESIDIQWGNHDMVWMGAAMGIKAYIANVLRIAARYDNLDTIEDGYGISILPLATFAMEHYKDDPCLRFQPKLSGQRKYNKKEIQMVAQMHKALSIIQFKLEAHIVQRNPQFEMDDRLLLDKINFETGEVTLEGKIYSLNDRIFPTINPSEPYQLTQEEDDLMERLLQSFLNSERLQRHIKFMIDNGGMYLVFNSNLLYHGCIPMNENGSFRVFPVKEKHLSGKALVDKYDEIVRKCYHNRQNLSAYRYEADLMWYLWPGPLSPLFGKRKMATFERYFVDDKETHAEPGNPYFKLRDKEETSIRILEEFGLNPAESHIINGHTPVKMKKGENPVKANGKMLVIDGGLSRAYQPETGIAGYTLIYNSYGLVLATHKPFESKKSAIEDEKDIITDTLILEQTAKRKGVGDTDIGAEIKEQIKDLELLLDAYRKGKIKENL